MWVEISDPLGSSQYNWYALNLWLININGVITKHDSFVYSYNNGDTGTDQLIPGFMNGNQTGNFDGLNWVQILDPILAQQEC